MSGYYTGRQSNIPVRVQQRQERDRRAIQRAQIREQQEASHGPPRSTASAPEELHVPEEAEWLPEHEDIFGYASPHLPGHLMSSPQGVPVQRGIPYHTAARADSRVSIRAVQSAPETPGREQDPIPLEELYPSREEELISMGLSRQWSVQTPPRVERELSLEAPSPTQVSRRMTSVGVEDLHRSSEENVVMDIIPEERGEPFPASTSRFRLNEEPVRFSPSIRRRMTDGTSGNTSFLFGSRGESRERPREQSEQKEEEEYSLEHARTRMSSDRTFQEDIRVWGREQSLLSPPYRNMKVEPSTELSLRLRDLMAIGKCTKYELEKAMRYYVRLMGRETDPSLNFWSLASHFRKLMSHNPSELPRGLLNPLLADRDVYENAIWIYHILKDPEQMEKITRATDERDASTRASKIDYPLTPSMQGVTQSRLNSPTVSLMDRTSSFRKEHEDQPSSMADQFRYTSQYRDQLRISARARQSKSAEKREIVIPYEQRESS